MIKSIQGIRSLLSVMILKEKNPQMREALTQSKMAWIKKLSKLEKTVPVWRRWEIEQKLNERKNNQLRKNRGYSV